MTELDDLARRRTAYESAGLEPADLDPDPVSQWRHWYDDAVEAGLYEPNAMVVSTVDADGRPDARYVLLRGADLDGFTFFTNLGSAKSRQLAVHPAASLTFGWLALHRQVRVRGSVSFVDDDEADEYWASRPRESQVASAASPQSQVLRDRSELDRLVAQVDAAHADRPVPRPAGWSGYRVQPDEIEFWQGRPARLHDRLRYRRGDGPRDAWIIERLAP